MASGIPQSQLNVLAVNFNIGNIVFKHRRDVHLGIAVRLCSAITHENDDLGKCAFRKDDQETGLHQEVSRNEKKIAVDTLPCHKHHRRR